MILILSKNQETTTNEVIKWLEFYNKKWIRVNEDEFFEIKIKNKKIYLISNKNSFFLDDITSVWYRRGGLRFKRLEYDTPSVRIHMDETQYWLEDYIIKTLESKKHINKQSNSRLNKLLVLEQAVKVGLKVPKYFLAENTNDVIIDKTITKSIAENIIFDSVDEFSDGIMYTAIVEEKEEEDFFVTFFQKKIEKDFEIRCFYLAGKIWSIAIISQNDEKTKIDFRKYNHEVPNRNIPYILPIEVKNKLNVLMSSLDLNCGSIDFIKRGNDYYFLEINPIGQFLGLSDICNYNLDKEIAMYL